MLSNDQAPFAPDAFTVALGVGRTEAEALTIGAGFAVQSNPNGSGGAFLQATASASSAGGVFGGTAGVYDLTIGYVDETDGVSHFEVVVDGTVVDAFDWDGTFGDALATPSSLASRTIADVALSSGSQIVLRGMQDGGEPLRTDYIDIAASAAPSVPPAPSQQPSTAAPAPSGGAQFTVEAEDLTILSGFAAQANANASGGEFLQATGSGEARAAYTVPQGGLFDLTVGYFDETDGVSTLSVLVNGTAVDTFAWDGTFGTGIASAQSRAERTIEGLTLQAGDRIELVGTADGGEPLRVDGLRFEPATSAPPPVASASPDLFYVDGGTVVLALNDGAGGFTQTSTGITLPAQTGDVESGVFAGDYDGDGDADLLVATAEELSGFNDPGGPESTLTATFYTNDGAAGFTAGDPATITVAATDVRVLDAADADGDGDVDLLVGQSFDTVTLLLNDGAGAFAGLSEAFGPGAPEEGRLADLDGDGDLDAVTAGSPDSAVFAFETVAGVLLEQDVVFGGNDGNQEIQILDLDGDGGLDALFRGVGEDTGFYAYLPGGTNGSGADSAALEFDGDSGVDVGPFVAGDFDGDAAIEIVAPGIVFDDPDDGIAPGLRIYEVAVGDGTVAFVLDSFTPRAEAAAAVGVGDFDGDGDLDYLERSGPNDAVVVQFNDGTGAFTAGAGSFDPAPAFDAVIPGGGYEALFFDDFVFV